MLALHIAGLRVDNSKSVIVKSWNKVRGKWTNVVTLEHRDPIDYLLVRNIIQFRYSFQQQQICRLQPKNFVPQYSEFNTAF